VLALVAAALVLTSPAFHAGGRIPSAYTCARADVSPPLRWSGVPHRARTLALRLDDPDAPGGTFTHWTVWNLPTSLAAIGANLGGHWRFEGTNSFGRIGYGGPCPPPGPPHHYVFRLYALDARLRLRRGATRTQFAAALRRHVLGTARLVGLYGR
jgi:Raf kinase inhibitor-like YbhB/YbcL family protein